MKLSEFTQAIINVSEKAAQIARLIRSEKALFSLLVEEKTGESKNKRFVQDFKTLADVLIQETVRHDLELQFPGIGENIHGEESNKFTNTLGETVEVQVQATAPATKQLLAKVLSGNDTAAELLANKVHEVVTMDTEDVLEQASMDVNINDVGVWIDPIDSTAQYIHGYEGVEADNGIYKKGLQCVVVLIGAFDLHTGEPVAGIVNQPFSQKESSGSWTGRTLWGINYKDCCLTCCELQSTNQTSQQTPVNAEGVINGAVGSRIVLSSSEQEDVQAKLRLVYDLIHAAGAGYKIMCVMDSVASAYILTQGSTFKWDTCGPQALLQALGGGIVDLKKALDIMKGNSQVSMKEIQASCSIVYHKADRDEVTDGTRWSNSGGLVAYRDINVLKDILKIMSS